jgi:hypothetical protein
MGTTGWIILGLIVYGETEAVRGASSTAYPRSASR